MTLHVWKELQKCIVDYIYAQCIPLGKNHVRQSFSNGRDSRSGD